MSPHTPVGTDPDKASSLTPCPPSSVTFWSWWAPHVSCHVSCLLVDSFIHVYCVLQYRESIMLNIHGDGCLDPAHRSPSSCKVQTLAGTATHGNPPPPPPRSRFFYGRVKEFYVNSASFWPPGPEPPELHLHNPPMTNPWPLAPFRTSIILHVRCWLVYNTLGGTLWRICFSLRLKIERDWKWADEIIEVFFT